MAWLEQGIYKKSETPVMKAYRQQDMKAIKLTDDPDNEAQVHVWHGRTLTDIPEDWWSCKLAQQLVGKAHKHTNSWRLVAIQASSTTS